jgi:hypothetical protein
LEKIGNVPIREILVCRRPLNIALNFIAKLLSKNAPYDEFFHLFLNVNLADGTSWKFEKEHVVSLKLCVPSDFNNATCFTLPRPVRGMTLNKAISQAQSKNGMERTWFYDPIVSNCQVFALDMIGQIVGNINENTRNFIYQDVKTLFSEKTHKVARSITDLAGWWDHYIHGAGV